MVPPLWSYCSCRTLNCPPLRSHLKGAEREAAPVRALEPAVRADPVPELPAPAIRQPGGTDPGDQYRLFEARREDSRSGPGR